MGLPYDVRMSIGNLFFNLLISYEHMKSNKQKRVDKKRGLPEPPSNPKMKKQKDNENNIAKDSHLIKLPRYESCNQNDKIVGSITLSDYFNLIKANPDKAIESVRSIDRTKNEAKYKAAKSRLPQVHVSEYNGNHTGIIAMDVDPTGNDLELINSFNDPDALAYHRSVGGIGLVAYYRIDPTKHSESFIELSRRLDEQFNLTVDNQTKPIKHPRIISSDKHIVINWNAPVIDTDIKIKQTTSEPVTDVDRNEWIRCTELAEENNMDLLGDRKRWTDIASGLRHAFKDDPQGFDLFNRLSKISDNYKGEDDCRKTYLSFKPDHPKPITIASLIQFMKDDGVDPVVNVPIKGIDGVTSTKNNYESVKVAPATYLKPEHISKLIAQCSVSPFMNVEIKWYFDEEISNCASSALLIGEPEIGRAHV